jgi:hypothetical protein
VPTLEKLVTQLATPAPLTPCAPQPPIVWPLLRKATVPEGVAPEPVTVAVRVVFTPTVMGDGLTESVTTLEVWFTISDTVPVEVE